MTETVRSSHPPRKKPRPVLDRGETGLEEGGFYPVTRERDKKNRALRLVLIDFNTLAPLYVHVGISDTPPPLEDDQSPEGESGEADEADDTAAAAAAEEVNGIELILFPLRVCVFCVYECVCVHFCSLCDSGL